MALARTYAMALAGVRGHVVEIEADIENGLVALLLVGLPDTALREARDRIRSAIINSRQSWPQRRITVGLSPASLPKRGSGFDVAMAVAILSADGVLAKEGLAGTVFLGELGLDGRIRAVPGVLPSVAAAVAAGFSQVVVPVDNAAEAALVPEVRVVAAPTLSGLIDWLRDGDAIVPGSGVQVVDSGGGLAATGPDGARTGPHGDLADVVGQPVARRAAEICAAGGHHMLLLGPPGTGKPIPGLTDCWFGSRAGTVFLGALGLDAGFVRCRGCCRPSLGYAGHVPRRLSRSAAHSVRPAGARFAQNSLICG
jgi:magnesium chelatase family protein